MVGRSLFEQPENVGYTSTMILFLHMHMNLACEYNNKYISALMEYTPWSVSLYGGPNI